jgi:hypothetical protein
MSRPAEGVKLFLLGDEGILFDQAGQRLFHLNAAAACIWCHAENGHRVEAVTDAFARSMKLGKDLAAQFVSEMLQKWQHLGLFRQGRPRTRSVGNGVLPQDAWQTSPTPPPILGVQIAPRRRQYRLLDTSFLLGFSSSAIETAVHPVLAHLELPQATTTVCQLDVIETAGIVHVVQEGRVLGRCAADYSAASVIQGILGLLALRRLSFFIGIHAAGLASPDGALLLAGEGGSGKTTLAAALVADGWDYLSDDAVLLKARTLDAVGVPYSLAVKAGSWPILASLYPELADKDIHLRQDDKRVRYLSPPRRDFDKPRPVRWIVFLRREAGAIPLFQRLGRLEGLQSLMEHCCAIPKALKAQDVARLIRWSDGVQFFELVGSDIDVAVAELRVMGYPPGLS